MFYSMLPPLLSMNISTLCEFDTKLTDAVQNLELPTGWHMITSGEKTYGFTCTVHVKHSWSFHVCPHM